jgi:Ca-activated chloride channel family protein
MSNFLPALLRVAMAAACIFLPCIAPDLEAKRRDTSSRELRAASRADKSALEMVMLRVTVSDRKGAPVSNLPLAQFTVFDNDRPQKIAFFQNEEKPASVGILLDSSNSVRRVMRSYDLQNGIAEMIRAGAAQTRYFLVTIGRHGMNLSVDWTTDAGRLAKAVQNVAGGGVTTLFDAIFSSTEKMNREKASEPVLVVVSDGADTASQHSWPEVRQSLGRSNLIVYAIGMLDGSSDPNDEFGRRGLSQMAALTGGVFYSPLGAKATADAFSDIARELRSQYVIGYYPEDFKRDGKWRKVGVEVTSPDLNDPAKVNASSKPQALSARTRTGYFAPRD